MMEGRVYGNITSEKGFYVGDCCYALDDETYDKWGDTDYKDGMIKVGDYKNSEFIVAGTAWGDGLYHDVDGNSYPVDAGVISAIPYEILEQQEKWKQAIDECGTPELAAKDLGGNFFKGTKCEFENVDGNFDINIGSTHIYIQTDFEDEEDDDVDFYEDEEETYDEEEYDED